MSDWKIMSLNDGHESWRQHQHRKVSRLVQKRFQYLMNPKDCSKGKYLRCSNPFPCGFGCQRIYYSLTMAIAYGIERTLIYHKSDDSNYEKDEYERYYEPISLSCNLKSISHKGGVRWGGKTCQSL